MMPDDYQNMSVTDTAAALGDTARELLTLTTYIETMQHDPSKENIMRAEQAAAAVLRTAPAAFRLVARIQVAAENAVTTARQRRDALMTNLYGADGPR